MFLKKFYCMVCGGHYFSIVREARFDHGYTYTLRCKECHREQVFDTDRRLKGGSDEKPTSRHS